MLKKKTILIAILTANIAVIAVAVYAVVSQYPGIKRQTAAAAVKEPEKQVPLPAAISVTSAPENAKVFINGYLKGRTPVKLTLDTASGSVYYRLTVLKQGYEKWSREIEPEAGKETEYSIILKNE